MVEELTYCFKLIMREERAENGRIPSYNIAHGFLSQCLELLKGLTRIAVSEEHEVMIHAYSASWLRMY